MNNLNLGTRKYIIKFFNITLTASFLSTQGNSVSPYYEGQNPKHQKNGGDHE